MIEHFPCGQLVKKISESGDTILFFLNLFLTLCLCVSVCVHVSVGSCCTVVYGG